MLQIGSFYHFRRLVACYCLPPFRFGMLTPRHLSELGRAVGSAFRTNPASVGRQTTDDYHVQEGLLAGD